MSVCLASNRFVGYALSIMDRTRTNLSSACPALLPTAAWTWILALALVPFLNGCASSTIESRKGERALAYSALSSEERTLVDQGQIRVGMSPDAVYVAWGQPAQVLKSGDSTGEVTTWLYTATATDTYHSWRYREFPRRDGTMYLDRSLDVDYSFRDYVSAELVFRDNKLERWRMLPKPPERDILSNSPIGY